jgi:hypothetical protein
MSRTIKPMDTDMVEIARRLLDGRISADGREPVHGMLPVGFEIVGDHAVTVFAGFTDHGDTAHTVVLARDGDTWRWLGGGSAAGSDGLTTPAARRLATWADRSPEAVGQRERVPALIVADDGGATAIDSGRWPTAGRYLVHVIVRAAQSIGTVHALGRDRPVPWHGRVVVGWIAGSRVERIARAGVTIGHARQRPEIIGIDRQGNRHQVPPERRPHGR